MKKKKGVVEISCDYPMEHIRLINESLEDIRRKDSVKYGPKVDIKKVREGDRVKVSFSCKGINDLTPVVICTSLLFYMKGFLRGKGIDMEKCIRKLNA